MGEFECPDCVLKHKVPYFVLVRVWNGAGLYSIATTQDARPDHTPPTSGTVIPFKKVLSCAQGCTLLYQVNGFVDEESGLQSCRFVIRNETGLVTTFQSFQLSGKVEVLGVEMTHGSKYIAVVSCFNAVGLVSSHVTSKETLVDNTPPTKVSFGRRTTILRVVRVLTVVVRGRVNTNSNYTSHPALNHFMIHTVIRVKLFFTTNLSC